MVIQTEPPTAGYANAEEVAPPQSVAPPTPLQQSVQDFNTNGAAAADDDEDDVTIIGLDQDPEQGGNDQQSAALAWIEQNGPEMEERRRNVLLRELQRVQRASFIHFILLCLIPTSLLFIVVATVLGEDENCESEATTCATEARTFMNAFTTRCICDAIDVTEGSN